MAKAEHQWGVGETADGDVDTFPLSELPRRLAEWRAQQQAETDEDDLSDLDEVEEAFDDDEAPEAQKKRPDAADNAGKLTKEFAEYVDAWADPQQSCSRCTMFRDPYSCTLVEGEISPQGHCEHFQAEGAQVFGADEWSEADHPRGQPENAGEFASAGGGGKALGSALEKIGREFAGERDLKGAKSKDKDKIRLFHGTTASVFDSIKKEGITSGHHGGADEWLKEFDKSAYNKLDAINAAEPYRKFSVYVSKKPSVAREFAMFAAAAAAKQGRGDAYPIVFVADVPKDVAKKFMHADSQIGSYGPHTEYAFEGAIKPEWILGTIHPEQRSTTKITPIGDAEAERFYIVVIAGDDGAAGDAFDPDEPRDQGGKWTSGGGGRGLTKEEKGWVRAYTDEAFHKINHELRAGGKLSPDVAEAVKHLDSALAKSRLHEQATLHRALDADAAKKVLAAFRAKKGSVDLRFPGYTSTTMDTDVARGFADDASGDAVILSIDAPEGTSGLYTGYDEDLVEHFGEDEVILPRGTRVTADVAGAEIGTISPNGKPRKVLFVEGKIAGGAAHDEDIVAGDFDPNEPRDETGKWTSGSGSSGAAKPASSSSGPGVKAKGLAEATALKQEWSRASGIDTVEALAGAAPRNQARLALAGSEIGAATGARFKNPGPKSRARIEEKVARGKAPADVRDAARAGFETDSPAQADRVVELLAKRFEVADEGWQRTPAGYFDRKVMVRFPDGMVGEVQFWPPGMLKAKAGEHRLYEQWQQAAPGPEKAKLMQAQLAVFAAVCAGLPAVWKAVVNC